MTKSSLEQLKRISYELQSLCGWIENPPEGIKITDLYTNTRLNRIIKDLREVGKLKE